MTRQTRRLLPWELRCGCPRCKASPGERCVTTRPLHLGPWTKRELAQIGTPTAAHKARYELWCHLWGRKVCVA